MRPRWTGACAVPKVPVPVPRRIEVRGSPFSGTARSRLPSALKSPIATEPVPPPPPIGKLTTGEKRPRDGTQQDAGDLHRAVADHGQIRDPVLVEVADATNSGWSDTANAVGAPNVPSPFPIRTEIWSTLAVDGHDVGPAVAVEVADRELHRLCAVGDVHDGREGSVSVAEEQRQVGRAARRDEVDPAIAVEVRRRDAAREGVDRQARGRSERPGPGREADGDRGDAGEVRDRKVGRPSRLKSATATSFGDASVGRLTGAPNVPAPVPMRMETVFPKNVSTVTRSTRPSPLKSPLFRKPGPWPAAVSTRVKLGAVQLCAITCRAGANNRQATAAVVAAPMGERDTTTPDFSA